MASADIERRVAAYYAKKLRDHGATHQGVDWNSDESQVLRFEQFMRIVDPDRRPSVLDWGCGYGAFAEYLERRGVPARYVGYDVAPEMIAVARARFGGSDDRTFTDDRGTLTLADITVASGIFNVLADTPRDAWQEYTLDTIRDLAALTRRGLAFNMLTSYSDPERMQDRLFYGDPGFYFDWCKRNLSRHVALLHDYGLYEFTILVRFEVGATPGVRGAA
jgi:SAM-dependent methyltransferase